MKKQIQLAGTYHTLKYIKNQFNLLKKKTTNNRHIVTIRVLNPAEKKKKDLKRNQTFNNKMCANHTLKSILYRNSWNKLYPRGKHSTFRFLNPTLKTDCSFRCSIARLTHSPHNYQPWIYKFPIIYQCCQLPCCGGTFYTLKMNTLW